jgi:N-acetylglucosamine kinase-like BadF-type ATPase
MLQCEIKTSRRVVSRSFSFTCVVFDKNLDCRIVAVVAGTGSIASSFRLESGIPREVARSGGWGWILGDEGSGFHVGRETIRHLLREYEVAVLDGKPLPTRDNGPQSLRSLVLDHFNVSTAPELLARLGSPDDLSLGVSAKDTKNQARAAATREKRLSQLSPLVFRAAFGQDGIGGMDPLALDVLRTTSDALAEQISLLLKPFSLKAPNDTTSYLDASSSIIVFGGSLVGIQAYRVLILNALKARGHDFAGVEYVSDAAETGVLALYQRFSQTT